MTEQTIAELLVTQVEENVKLNLKLEEYKKAIEHNKLVIKRQQADFDRKCDNLHKQTNTMVTLAVERAETGFNIKHKELITNEKRLTRALESARKATIDFGDMKLALKNADVIFTNKTDGEDFDVPEVQFKSFLANLAGVINNAYFDDDS